MSLRKQSLDNAEFASMRARATLEFSKAHISSKVARAAEEISAMCRGRASAFAWSGGKDSVALEYVARVAGVSDSVLGICDLEYPAFLAWVTVHMPGRLEVINTGLDLDWLADHQEMLFPQSSAVAAHWFAMVQHKAQRKFCRDNDVEVLILGRRRDDGNFVGRCGENFYENAGTKLYSPLADWSHGEIFALIDHYQLALPPFYTWPRGYRCGTHPWPARQWCRGIGDGWREVHQIDPSIVHMAATRLQSARDFLEVA